MKLAKDHYWVNPSGLSKRDKDKLREATRSGTEGRGHTRRKQNPVLPNQYIGKGPAAKKAAEKIARDLKGAKVVAESFGAQSSSQKLWERLAHSLIDRFLKGK